MKILVTGGAGFIGHNVAIVLKNHGFEVVVLDSLERASEQAINRLKAAGVPIIKGNILNDTAVRNALVGVKVVVHAAAYISVEESLQKPAQYFRNNVAATANIAKNCLDKNVELIIYVSSAAVYGEPKHLPINEMHPTNPTSPYGLSKLMGEEVVKFYGGQGLNYVILRLFNVYGLGQTGAYAGVITNFIENAKNGKPPIIYGDGQQTRDFIHVADVAEAIKRAIEKPPTGQTINIATGKPTTIKELAELIIKLSRLNLKPIFAEPRPRDIKHSCADIALAKRLLGFEPKITLEEGLKSLME
ncbi:MAG: NAD-dependent epimerase/dehydratase family protein [Nitrososphaeria archaeon]